MNRQSLDDYTRKVAQYLREREAGRIRGQRERLAALDLVSDEELLRKWTWMSAIGGILVAFVGLPLGINIFRIFLPYELVQILWAVHKVAMAIVLAMFCVALYFTFRRNAA